MEEVSAFLVQYGSLEVFSVVFAEQIGLPLPAIPVLVAAGALASGRSVRYHNHVLREARSVSTARETWLQEVQAWV